VSLWFNSLPVLAFLASWRFNYPGVLPAIHWRPATHPETRRRLNAINRSFYEVAANDFDQTRAAPWPGWERLLPHLRLPLAVLDVGCGNGRFGLFLHDRLHPTASNPLTYTGLDSSLPLLERARAALTDRVGLTLHLHPHDLTEQPLHLPPQDVIALFGVLHHIPGAAERAHLLRSLAAALNPGGLLVLTVWRFLDFPRFRQRIIPWPEDIQPEPDDYLLDWRRGPYSLRYCHHTGDAELQALVAATNLIQIDTFRADGPQNRANLYLLLRR
jgi:SAM-dependent methyltransferase